MFPLFCLCLCEDVQVLSHLSHVSHIRQFLSRPSSVASCNVSHQLFLSHFSSLVSVSFLYVMEINFVVSLIFSLHVNFCVRLTLEGHSRPNMD